jgi:hypothetical protein
MADYSESIASDRDGAPVISLLTADTTSRLVEKFLSFMEDREKIRRRIESYVETYESRGENATDRYLTLEEEYGDDAPDLSHLVAGKDGSSGAALWSMRDIAIVLGRNVSNVLRAIRKMESSPEWTDRLAAHAVRNEQSGRDAAALYRTGVFDVIVDYYEQAYLERFTRPRRGAPMSAEERAEVFALWRYLKENPDEARTFYEARLTDESAFPEWRNASRTVYQNLRLIVRRAFSIKIGTFFLLLFALIYELSTRYSALNVIVPAASVSALVSSLLAMRAQGREARWLIDVGACAVTITMLWALAMIATPGGPASRLLPQVAATDAGAPRDAVAPEPVAQPYAAENTDRPDVTVEYIAKSRAGNGGFEVRINTGTRAREIFYRTSQAGDFKSTGFASITTADGTRFPIHSVTLKNSPEAGLFVKYTDIEGTSHGPYRIQIDPERDRMERARSILDSMDWVEIDLGRDGTTVSTKLHTEIFFRMRADDILERIMYGINKRTPNRERVLPRWGDEDEEFQFPETWQVLYSSGPEEKIWFVSAQLFFSDGSCSDVRIFDNQHAEPD